MQYVLIVPPGTTPWDHEALPRHRENTVMLYHTLPDIRAVCAWCGHPAAPEQVMSLYVTPRFCDLIVRCGGAPYLQRTHAFWEHHAAPLFFDTPTILRGHVPCIVQFFAPWHGTPVYETAQTLKNLFSPSAAHKLPFVYHLTQYLSTPEFSLADHWYARRDPAEKSRVSTHIAHELTQYLDDAIVPPPHQELVWRFLLSQLLTGECLYHHAKPSVSELVISVLCCFDKFDSAANTKQYLQRIYREHFRNTQTMVHYVETLLKKTFLCFVTRGRDCYWTAYAPPPLFSEEESDDLFIA